MEKNRKNIEDNVFGISPLGGNSVEGTDDGFAAVIDDEVQAVPLTYDYRVGAYVSDLAIMELDDLDISRIKADAYREEQDFWNKVGIRQTVE